MSMYNLTSQLIKINEEASADAGVSMSSPTTMSSITYLPSTMGAIKSSIYSLVKMKSDWDIELLEDENQRKVNFESALSITVPNQYWDKFSQKFGIASTGSMSLGHLLKEAIDEELSRLRNDLKFSLTAFYEYEDFLSVEKQTNLWRSFFGVVKQQKINTAVTFEHKEKDIQFLYSKLLKVYGDDKGNLELLVEALEKRKNINTFEIFNKFDFLYGTKLLSIYRKVDIMYEAAIDTSYQFSQSVLIDSSYTDVLEALEDIRDIKIVRNVIYPVGPSFSRAFYKELKNTIKNVVD